MNQNREYTYESNNTYKEQRMNVLNLLKENQILKGEIQDLIEENKNLNSQLKEYERVSKGALNDAYNRINELKEELSQSRIEKDNEDKFLHEFMSKAKNDNDTINQLEGQIETLKEEIQKLNSKITVYQSKEIDYNTNIQNMNEKYLNIISTNENLIKENSKLKKNLKLFANENHCAALKIKELEAENKNEELNLIIENLLEKINNITLIIKNKTNNNI